MFSVSRAKSDIKMEFEGGNSLSIDYYQLLRRAADRMLGEVYPDTLKRVAPIYGGMTSDVFAYYCPSDVLVPTDIYTNDGLRKFTFVPATKFYRSTDTSLFTLEYINGVRFLVTRYANQGGYDTLDAMESLANKTATGVTLSLNTHDKLFGTYSVQGIFTTSNYTISGTFDEVDITSKLWGIARIAVNLSSAVNVSNVTLRLHSSDSDYYTMSTSADSINDKLVDGWNMLRFDMGRRSQTGSPDSTAIIKWTLIFTLSASTTIILDSLIVQETEKTYLEYISNLMFVDATTYQWKNEPERDSDLINLDRDSAQILHYEACRLAGRKSIAGLNFTDELAREYQQYWEKHPSDAQALTYSISSDVGMAPATASEFVQEEEASSTTADSISFMNAITPTGTVDGVNVTFTLPIPPDPADSLQLFYNGAYQTEGTDYTLSGSTITMVIAPSVALVAYYRY